MRTCLAGRRWITGIAIVFLGVALVACNLSANKASGPGQGPAAKGPVSGGAGGEQSEAPAQAPGGETQSGQGEAVVEPDFEAETLPCPSLGTSLILGFDHALTVNYQETSLTHFLHQGFVLLKVVDDEGTISSEAVSPIPYSMEGRMSDECALTGEGTMTPSVQGSCENGVVRLFINENWSGLAGEMECIDSDGDVVIAPFNVPPMGLQQHEGPDGLGEIFYLVEGSEGYSTMRPFAEGEGYHTWTLYTEEIPLVPLVP